MVAVTIALVAVIVAMILALAHFKRQAEAAAFKEEQRIKRELAFQPDTEKRST